MTEVFKEEAPLIWTTKGNIPVSDLHYRTQWQITEEYISFTESYFLGDELVKSSTHVHSNKPLESESAQSEF